MKWCMTSNQLTLVDLPERVWQGAARECTNETDAATQPLQKGSVKAMLDITEAQVLSIGGLHFTLLQWLNDDHSTIGSPCSSVGRPSNIVRH